MHQRAQVGAIFARVEVVGVPEVHLACLGHVRIAHGHAHLHGAQERIAHRRHVLDLAVGGGAAEIRIAQIGGHRLDAFCGRIEKAVRVGAVRADHVGTRPRFVEIDLGVGARIRVRGNRAVRAPEVDPRLDLVDIGIEVGQVRIGAAARGQRAVAQLLKHDDVPALRGDVAAQVPSRRIGVEVMPAQ